MRSYNEFCEKGVLPTVEELKEIDKKDFWRLFMDAACMMSKGIWVSEDDEDDDMELDYDDYEYYGVIGDFTREVDWDGGVVIRVDWQRRVLWCWCDGTQWSDGFKAEREGDVENMLDYLRAVVEAAQRDDDEVEE